MTIRYVAIVFLVLQPIHASQNKSVTVGEYRCILPDWLNPTLEDYTVLQSFLQETASYRTRFLSNPDRIQRLVKFQLYNPNLGIPVRLLETFGNKSAQDIILVYCSQNAGYMKKFKRLYNHLKNLNFHGHLLYYLGGWPNKEAGCLKHCMVPYAFKPCIFLEALKLGYKRALWLDVSLIPLKNIRPIFDYIAKNESFVRLQRHSFSFLSKTNKQIISAMNMTSEEKKHQIQLAAGIIGLDLTSKRVKNFLTAWHDCALDGTFYLSNFPEEFPMSILMNRQGFLHQHHDYNLLRNSIASKLPLDHPNEAFFLLWYQLSDPLKNPL